MFNWFLWWTKIPWGNCSWINKFVGTDVIISLNNAAFKFLSKLEKKLMKRLLELLSNGCYIHQKYFLIDSVVLCFSFCHLFDFFFYPVCNTLHWNIIIIIIIIVVIFRDNLRHWGRFSFKYNNASQSRWLNKVNC